MFNLEICLVIGLEKKEERKKAHTHPALHMLLSVALEAELSSSVCSTAKETNGSWARFGEEGRLLGGNGGRKLE